MLTIVGVGHVFDIGEQVKGVITERSPSLVCLELDKARYMALKDGERKGSNKVPVAYKLLATFQKSVADKYDTRVGGEMLSAADAAREVGADLAFIDMDASVAFLKIWHDMGFKRKAKMLFSAFVGMFAKKEYIEEEIERFQENEAEYMEAVSQEFPEVKKVLIDDRNRYMASALRKLSERYENIVAIVGDGHVEGMRGLLEDMEPDVIRLKELRDTVYTTETSSISMTYTQGGYE